MTRGSSFIRWSIFAIAGALVTATAQAQFAYVTNSGSNTISAYAIGPTGTLTPLGSAATGSAPVGVAADPTGRFLYVANDSGDTISAYRIGSDGRLTTIAPPVLGGFSPAWLAVDPTGRFLYVTNISGNNVSLFSIGFTGALALIGSTPPLTGSGPNSLAVDPTGRFLYVANGYGNSISIFNILPDPALVSAGPPLALGWAPAGLAVDPTGRYLYVVGGGGWTPISAFRIGATGGLTLIGTTPPTAQAPISVAVNPTGTLAFVANHAGGVSAFSIGPTGALTAIGSPAPAGLSPRSVAVDPSGRFVYVVNHDGDTVSAFGVTGAGALASLGPSTVVGDRPYGIAISAGPANLSSTLAFADFRDLSKLTLNGSAHGAGDALRLTDYTDSQAGSAFLTTPFSLRPDSSFSTSFAFQIGGGSADCCNSDGLTFVVQNDPGLAGPGGAHALGAGGGGLGLGAIPGDTRSISPSIAVEFDTHQNASDPNDNHVALIVDGNVQDHKAFSTLPCPPPQNVLLGCLNSGSPVYVWIDYNGTTRRLSVFVAPQAIRPSAPLLSTVAPPLDQLSAHLNGRAFFGFTAGTGLGINTHDILTWALTVPGMAGDVNGDGALSCLDLAAVKASFGKRSGQTGFNPLADVNGDGLVDVRDLAFVSQRLPAGANCQ